MSEKNFDNLSRVLFASFPWPGDERRGGGHSIAPKTGSTNAANAKVRNRQMRGRPIIL